MDIETTDTGVRPAGKPGQCFYCQMPAGKHKDDCPCVSKTVVLRMKIDIEYVAAVPRFWDEQIIRSARNEGSWCSGNDLEKLVEKLDCLCDFTKIDFLRDATQADHDDLICLLREEIENRGKESGR